MTRENGQSMCESAWEKMWNNFYTSLTVKFEKKTHYNLMNYN